MEQLIRMQCLFLLLVFFLPAILGGAVDAGGDGQGTGTIACLSTARSPSFSASLCVMFEFVRYPRFVSRNVGRMQPFPLKYTHTTTQARATLIHTRIHIELLKDSSPIVGFTPVEIFPGIMHVNYI
jgi:hypothetical protein